MKIRSVFRIDSGFCVAGMLVAWLYVGWLAYGVRGEPVIKQISVETLWYEVGMGVNKMSECRVSDVG